MKAVKYLVAVVIKPFTNLKNLKRAWAFSFFKFLIGYNVPTLGEEAELKAQTFILVQMPIERTNVQLSTKTAFLPSVC